MGRFTVDGSPREVAPGRFLAPRTPGEEVCVMWTPRNEDASALSLRAGVALVGIDPEALWVDCCAAAGETLPFGSVVAAVLESRPTDNRVWNIVADAIDVRVMKQGLAPLFSPRPVLDLEP